MCNGKIPNRAMSTSEIQMDELSSLTAVYGQPSPYFVLLYVEFITSYLIFLVLNNLGILR